MCLFIHLRAAKPAASWVRHTVMQQNVSTGLTSFIKLASISCGAQLDMSMTLIALMVVSVSF